MTGRAGSSPSNALGRGGVAVAVACLGLLAAMCFAAPAQSLGKEAGESVTFSARELFERGVGRGVQLSAAGDAVELEWGELYEDDGPAAGYSYSANDEMLSDTVWARKELVIDRPAPKAARLLVAPGGDLRATINGRPATLADPAKAGKYWQAYGFDPALLVSGRNEIVLHGDGRLWVARDQDFAAGSREQTRHPNRSARSGDAGRTWDDARLGPAGDLDGEYYVRVYLEHYRAGGSLRLPVIDAGNLAGAAVGPAVTALRPVRVGLDVPGEDADDRAGSVTVRARTGATFVPGAGWSEFKPVTDDVIANPAGRYIQLELELRTTDPRETPRLRGLTIGASPSRPPDDWTTRLRARTVANPPVVRSAVPFEYEPFDHPRLAALRRQFKLDDVVVGAASEFELITRLAAWSARQFLGGHLGESYPKWDALEILAPHADGTPVGGFCQQYNVVFLQACESFGIAGRAVSIGAGDGPFGREERFRSGHEVVEVWSNDYAKWVYVDGNAAWYFADGASGVPLSLLELRERQLATLAGRAADPVRHVKLADSPYKWNGLDGWPAFLELRLIPRSNFLAAPTPLPLNQGMRGWFWSGHHVWSDAASPASILYGNRVTRRGDFEWTVNGVRCVLEPGARRGTLRVHADTETPGLEAFVAAVDGGAPNAVTMPYEWTLRAGPNRLDVRTRNVAGRLGPVSTIELDWDG